VAHGAGSLNGDAKPLHGGVAILWSVKWLIHQYVEMAPEGWTLR
jgi:hypothetical protein